jgi:methylated-DNA-[protein]-cysteine S-methyltransferase
VAVARSTEKILRIFIPQAHLKDLFEEIKEYYPHFDVSEHYKELAENISKIFQGDEDLKMELISDIEWGTGPNKISNFEKKVLLTVFKIPRGEVRTYKEIACSLKSRGWRAVGNTMAKNPYPLLIPCHRVVKSDFTVGNYRGGYEMKKMLLKKEKIEIKGQKIVRP